MKKLTPPHELKESASTLVRGEQDRDYMKLITCHYTDRQIRFMNYLVEYGYYPNRSELQRDALGFVQRFYANIWREFNGGKDK